MVNSTRAKLIVSFLSVSLVGGSVALLVGGRLLYQALLNEATTRISLDLNAAREIYLARLRRMTVALNVTTLGPGFNEALARRDLPQLVDRLRRIARHAELDFAGIVTGEGRALCRIGPDSLPHSMAPVDNPLAGLALDRRTPVSGTVVLSKGFLLAENPELAERARISSLATPRAVPRAEAEETAGLALGAAIPIPANGELGGILYGGVLLNRSEEIVDNIRSTVFQDETYEGRRVGTATIFLGDLRISTNVLTAEGTRAIGTRVSREVGDRVLAAGHKWTDRAFVVSDWYITAYEPILDLFGDRVGMLYVGILEAKYAQVRTRALAVFISITLAGMVLAIGLGYALANKILRPVEQLVRASTQVTRGNLAPEIGPISKGEIGALQRTFTDMLSSLREREKRQQAESETKLLRSEKQASIGRLAAGVAHEINNPLTGVLMFTHMLLRRKEVSEDVRADLQTIARETERVRRIVKGLLEFARETKLQLEPTDVNELVRATIGLLENQALIKGVTLGARLAEDLPVPKVDRNQLQSVLTNLVLNALDATQQGDDISVSTGLSAVADATGEYGVEIAVADTGCGIPALHLGRLFDPFFTTKEVGQGTGLGLSVSLGIVENHGGTIQVESGVGRGSVFTVWLPAVGPAEGT
jgi:two-component system NtrC family sensor kinase